jgi:hypothetical protein
MLGLVKKLLAGVASRAGFVFLSVSLEPLFVFSRVGRNTMQAAYHPERKPLTPRARK